MQSVALGPQQSWTITKPQLIETAKRKTEDLVKYIKAKGYPNKRGIDQEQRDMAVLLATIRKEHKEKKQTQVTAFRLNYIKELMPNFAFDGVEQKFMESVDRLRDFIEFNNRVPRYGGDESDEKNIYSFMQRARHAYQTSDTAYLTPSRLKYIQEQMPYLELKPDTTDEFASKIK